MDLNKLIEEVSEKLDTRYSPDGTLQKIRINDKVPMGILKMAIDQVITLAKSDMAGFLYESLNSMMKSYFKLPAEKQVKVMPDKVKYITQLGKELRLMEEEHKSWNNPQKAQLINDDKELTADDKSSFEYDLTDIDWNIDVKDEVKPKSNTSNLEHIDLTGVFDDIELLKQQPELDREELYESEATDLYDMTPATHTPKEVFNAMKIKLKGDMTISKLMWKSSKGIIHGIYDDEEEFNKERQILLMDSTRNFNSSHHYTKKGNFRFWILRVK